MAKTAKRATVVYSDLSGAELADGERVSVLVYDLTGGPALARFDAALAELQELYATHPPPEQEAARVVAYGPAGGAPLRVETVGRELASYLLDVGRAMNREALQSWRRRARRRARSVTA